MIPSVFAFRYQVYDIAVDGRSFVYLLIGIFHQRKKEGAIDFHVFTEVAAFRGDRGEIYYSMGTVLIAK